MERAWTEACRKGAKRDELGGTRGKPSVLLLTGNCGNEPFGSRSEPGIYLTASIPLLPPGEGPEGRARGVQDTATRVQSESEA